jgi:hypothetical protein
MFDDEILCATPSNRRITGEKFVNPLLRAEAHSILSMAIQSSVPERPKKAKMYHDDSYVSLSISVPKSLRTEIHERALSLRLTRTDYVKALIIQDLSQGKDAPFALTYKPRPKEETPPTAPAPPQHKRRRKTPA